MTIHKRITYGKNSLNKNLVIHEFLTEQNVSLISVVIEEGVAEPITHIHWIEPLNADIASDFIQACEKAIEVHRLNNTKL